MNVNLKDKENNKTQNCDGRECLPDGLCIAYRNIEDCVCIGKGIDG